MRYKTLIIDDEPPAIQRLKELLGNFPDTFDVIGDASNGAEAVAIIRERNPDLLFLDIQMPGISGFQMLQKLGKIPLIIFCTAYDQYALQAFETNSIDYLVKPVSRERLEQTISKLSLINKTMVPDQIIGLLQQLAAQMDRKPVTSLTIRRGNKMLLVKLEDVVYMEARDKYVSLFTEKGAEFLTEHSLIKLEEKLPSHFLRIHRAYIINTKYLKEIEPYFNGRYIITLKDSRQTRLTTGRNYQAQIKKWLEI